MLRKRPLTLYDAIQEKTVNSKGMAATHGACATLHPCSLLETEEEAGQENSSGIHYMG